MEEGRSEGEPRPIFVLALPPAPPPPPRRRFGICQALLTVGGAALLFILARAQVDISKHLNVLCTSTKQSVQIREKALQIGEKAMDIGEKAVQIGEKAVQIGEKAVDIGEKAVDIGEQLASKGIEFKYNVYTGKGHATIRGGYHKILQA